MASTPLRAIRVCEQLWAAAREKAERDGTNVTAVIRAALEQYIAE